VGPRAVLDAVVKRKIPGVWGSAFLASVLEKVNGQLHAPAALLQGKDPGIQWTGGWVGPIAGLDTVAKRKNHHPCRESNAGRPTHRSATILTELSCLALKKCKEQH
jgi:hypothetical protein